MRGKRSATTARCKEVLSSIPSFAVLLSTVLPSALQPPSASPLELPGHDALIARPSFPPRSGSQYA